MYTIDTETCGLHGIAVLLQYAKDDETPQIHDIWLAPISETLDLIERLLTEPLLGFNLAFDFFHLCKLYTTFTLAGQKYGYNIVPEDYIDEIAELEEQARFSDICLKPKSACDIMLLARKGKYQSLMAREPIRIRKVPTEVAWILAEELERRVFVGKEHDIYFVKSKDKTAPKWKVLDRKNSEGEYDPNFKDVVLRFKASGALKVLYRHAFNEAPRHTYREIEVDRKFWPEDLGYAPYALAIGTRRDWKGAWPDYIKMHIRHWGYNKEARQYASDDIEYTRRLWKEEFGSPEPGDDDSVLSCMVAACRWRGYAVDVPRLKQLRIEALERISKVPTAPHIVKRWILETLSPEEKMAVSGDGKIGTSTKKAVLLHMSTHEDWINHPAGKRAKEVLDARKAKKEIEVYDKLILAKRFHASFRVIGALSSRMSGADGLNPQGINHEKFFRKCFPLADKGHESLSIGDFKSFEVSIALKVFDDPILNAEVRKGTKVHGLMGMLLFPGHTYEQILASEGQNPDMYDIGKKGFFLKVYFGNAHTFEHKLGRPGDIAEQADAEFDRKYKGAKFFQDGIRKRFTCLTQVGGIGSKIEWSDPEDYVESFLGFRRLFTLENRVIKSLFDLASDPTPAIKNAKVKVVRRDRVQTAGGAARSSLFGAAFGVMSGNIRAAGNHEVQSPGAQITKALQCNIWRLQPKGISPWIVRPMNVHDEVICPTRHGHEDAVREKVDETVAHYKKIVPLLAIDWVKDAPNWAEKKG